MKDFYKVVFWDHCEGPNPVQCMIYGWIVDESDLHYKLSYWLVLDEDEDTVLGNTTDVCILKSAIVSMDRA